MIIPEDVLGSGLPPASDQAYGDHHTGIIPALWRAAHHARDTAAQRAQADRAAGGCAHLGSTPAYRPGHTLRDQVTARDCTCRFLTCRQPAWRGDLDHTIPYDQGGRTCGCNLGGKCRTHHKIKQLQGWTLRQVRPGVFQWTTPAGRTYTVTPDRYNA